MRIKQDSRMFNNRGMKRKTFELTNKPTELSVVQYAQSRATEIEALSKDISTNTGTRKVFQSLPIHMRRRAMSHNIKRLPRRLQKWAGKEFDKNAPNTKLKKPSRKHRRRPKNLLEEYQRRQRKQMWLETHIWHAKRFHMEDRWGYRIPLHSTEKSIKATYRATQKYCQIQDISYMCCIEITGKEEDILDGLSHMTNSNTGLTFGAKATLSGTREGETCVYRCDQYPYHPMGSVTFLWKPVEDIRRQLWVWCHPSCYNELWEQLKICYGNKSTISEETTSTEAGACDSDSKEQTFISGDVTLKSLKDKLNRHRLTGPMANQIVHEVLRPANIIDQGEKDQWWQCYYQDSARSSVFMQQEEFIENMETVSHPGEYTPHCIVGITVGDPRLAKPKKRTMVLQTIDTETDKTCCSDKILPEVSLSPLWDPVVQDQVKATKISDQKLNQIKSELLIPGSAPDLGIEESRVPVILVQRPDVRHGISLNYGSGWDVILPQNWSMAFWVAFIYRGARAAGIRDAESLNFEQKMPYFPNDFPDSFAGCDHEKNMAEKLKNKYDKRPPAKRCNYNKLSITSPFSYPWLQLVQDWNVDSHGNPPDKFYVLRERKFLKKLEDVLTRCSKMKTLNIQYSPESVEINSEVLSIINEHCLSLVNVELAMIFRGVPDEHAIICIPVEEDIRLLQSDNTYSGPREPLKKKEHNKNKKAKTKNSCASVTGIRNSCSRQIIGFVNRGGFTFGSGNGTGQGLCAIRGLKTLIEMFKSDSPIIVLVRNPTSYQYRFAQIKPYVS